MQDAKGEVERFPVVWIPGFSYQANHHFSYVPEHWQFLEVPPHATTMTVDTSLYWISFVEGKPFAQKKTTVLVAEEELWRG